MVTVPRLGIAPLSAPIPPTMVALTVVPFAMVILLNFMDASIVATAPLFRLNSNAQLVKPLGPQAPFIKTVLVPPTNRMAPVVDTAAVLEKLVVSPTCVL